MVLVPPLFFKGLTLEWYTFHKWGAWASAVDYAAVTLKFHFLSFFPTFFLGCATARVLVDWFCGAPGSKEQTLPPRSLPSATLLRWIMRRGATIGYGGLAVIFSIKALRPPAAKLSLRLGLLAPLQALVLIGLALESPEDPVAVLFATRPLEVLGDFSFAQYSSS